MEAHDYSRLEPIEPGGGRSGEGLWKRIGSALAAIGVVLAKIGTKAKLLLVALPKLKLLTTSGSMLVSIVAYQLIFGWAFAVGFVLLLLLHELGHVIQLRREGVEASAPMFIPFLGAVISAKSLGENAAAEARVGLAGPILGSLATLVPLGLVADQPHRPLARVARRLALIARKTVQQLAGFAPLRDRLATAAAGAITRRAG